MATRKPPLSLKGQALAWLAQREHSASELRRKLLRHAKARRAAPQTGSRARADLPSAPGFGGRHEPAEGRHEADEADLQRVDDVIAWLRAHHYLSEERFVESRVHARAARYGNLRIRQELARHGLQVPAEAAQALKASEVERATQVWRRKFGRAATSAGEKARQSRFLAQRGFSPETIARVMRLSADDPMGEPSGDDVVTDD